MAYFDRFPVVVGYEFNNNLISIIDITRRTGIPNSIKNNDAFYILHEIKEGESPIILADRLYDDSDLYWVIMEFNDIYNIDTDWPMTQHALDQYVNRVYEDPYSVRHYESMSSGLIVDDNWPAYDRVGVSYYDHEIKKNDAKRLIKMPIPETIGQLVRDHRRLIQQ